MSAPSTIRFFELVVDTKTHSSVVNKDVVMTAMKLRRQREMQCQIDEMRAQLLELQSHAELARIEAQRRIAMEATGRIDPAMEREKQLRLDRRIRRHSEEWDRNPLYRHQKAQQGSPRSA